VPVAGAQGKEHEVVAGLEREETLDVGVHWAVRLKVGRKNISLMTNSQLTSIYGARVSI